VRLQIGRVDHDRATLSLGAGQPLHHPNEDAGFTPPLSAIVEYLVRPIGSRRIPPAQAVPIDEDDPAQHPTVIHPGPAVALGEEGFQPSHLLVRQPIQVTHIQTAQEPESDRVPHFNGS
jgi:hypothetical protein